MYGTNINKLLILASMNLLILKDVRVVPKGFVENRRFLIKEYRENFI